MRDRFLAGATVVLKAVSDERVAARWDEPSALEDQTIGSLAGHLARGGVWVVDEYLDRPLPPAPVDFQTAANYYAAVADSLTESDHAAARERGATIAAAGHIAVVARLGEALTKLRARLKAEPAHRLIPVYGGSVMRLDDYLRTRIVEQVVHLDDLARSLGIAPWPNAPGAEDVVVNCGAEIGRIRHGGQAMVRALFRDGAQGALPVL